MQKVTKLTKQRGFRLIFIFSYLPLYGWIYAFFHYKPGRALLDCQFVGLDNFKTMIMDKYALEELVRVLRNTFAMSFLGILTSPLPMLFFWERLPAFRFEKACRP